MLEEVLTEVIAFEELREKLDGTVQTNNYKHQNLSNSGKSQLGLEEEQHCQETETIETQETVVGTVPPETCMGLLSRTVPPDRNSEIEEIRKEIRKIKQEISDKGNPEAGTVPPTINKTLQVGTVPPSYEVVKSTRKRKLVL